MHVVVLKCNLISPHIYIIVGSQMFLAFSFQHTHSLRSSFLHFSTIPSNENIETLQLIKNHWCSIMSMQREKMAKKSIGSLMRKKLSDITNNTNPPLSQQQLDTTLPSDNNFIQQLLKVNLLIYLLFILYSLFIF